MRVLVAIGALLAGAGAWLGLRSSDAPAPPAISPAIDAPAPPSTPPPTAARAELAPAPAASTSADAETTVLLPDGTRIDALNGARGAKPLQDAWPANVPWSPITGIEHSPAGVDWWVHADGSRSTTEMKWRDDLGRYDAVTRLARPTPKVAAPAPRQ